MSIDVDDLVAKISTGIYGDDRMTWSTIEAATTALSQLVAEVERLRGERAAVVAWLREGLTQLGQQTRLVSLGALLSDMVGVIERGEHRREEER